MLRRFVFSKKDASNSSPGGQSKLATTILGAPVAVAVAILVLSAPSQIAWAWNTKTVTSALDSVFANNCEALQGRSDRIEYGGAGYGTNLYAFCNSPGFTTGSSSTGGSTSSASSSEMLKKQKEGEKSTVKITQDLNLFMSGGFQKKDKSASPFEAAFDSEQFGLTFGVDREINKKLSISFGIAYDRQDATFASDQGGFDTDSYRAFVVASFLPSENTFLDILGSYGLKDQFTKRYSTATNNRATPTTIGGYQKSDLDIKETGLAVQGGYDFSEGNITFGPRLGFSYLVSEIDPYKEYGGTGLELSYSKQREQSLQGKIGFQATTAINTSFGVVAPEASIDFIHEFKRDQRSIEVTLVEDKSNSKFYFNNDEPDRHYVEAGVGAVLVLPNGIQAFGRVSSVQGQSYIDNYGINLGVKFSL